jgi:hypothetical protein
MLAGKKEKGRVVSFRKAGAPYSFRLFNIVYNGGYDTLLYGAFRLKYLIFGKNFHL